MEMLWQIANRAQEQIRLRRANTLGGGEWTENSDCAQAGAPRHFNVLRGVSDVDGIFRGCA